MHEWLASAHDAQILKEHGFIQGLEQISALCLCTWNDTHDPISGSITLTTSWWKFQVEDPSDGDAAMGASFLNRVICWYPTSGRTDLESRTRHVAMMLRDLGLQK